VVVGALVGLGLLGFAVWRHHHDHDQPLSTRSDPESAATFHFLTVILWFFQVAHALQVSQQINAAQRGDSSADFTILWRHMAEISSRRSGYLPKTSAAAPI
jgi:hypothetical protein